MVEGNNFINGSIRIGSEINDNVNVVAFCLGFLYTIIFWSYTTEKKLWKLLLVVILVAISFFTGSKKTIVILLMNLIMYLLLEKGKVNKWFKVFFALVIIANLIFNIEPLYNVIGRRLENMYYTISDKNETLVYSYSTNVREKMITEGFNLFKENPIIGGGWGFFATRTHYGFNYSHNNYIEILCSFGLVGFIIYYMYHLKILKASIISIRKKSYYYKESILSLVFIIMTLILDWTAVTFSAQCVWYLPIIVSSAILSNYYDIKKEEEKNENIN